MDLELAGGRVLPAVPGDEGGELVAAEAGGGVPGPYGVLEAAGGLDEQFVAGLVAEPVVDALEPVEVDVEDGGAGVPGPAAAGPGGRAG